MKSLVIFILLLTTSLNGQTTKRTNDCILQDSWIISKYIFADKRSMTDKVAKEWKGGKVTVAKTIHFPFYDIPSHKNIFKTIVIAAILKNGICTRTQLYLPKNILNNLKSNILSSVLVKAIQLIRTNCTDTPSKELIVKNGNEIIMFWDGVFFTLQGTCPKSSSLAAIKL